MDPVTGNPLLSERNIPFMPYDSNIPQHFVQCDHLLNFYKSAFIHSSHYLLALAQITQQYITCPHCISTT